MTDIMTAQNIDLSSWATPYNLWTWNVVGKQKNPWLGCERKRSLHKIGLYFILSPS
jgi:hypothetical protein